MKRSSHRTNEELLKLYNKHVNTVYRVCFLYTKNTFDTESLVQDTFVKLMESSPVFENEEHEKAWLIKTASNLCKNFLKHWWNKTTDIEKTDCFVNELQYEDETLLKVMELPPKYKHVIFLYYYEGYSTVEIAKMIRSNESTVRGQLMKGRSLLKMVLEDDT